MKYLLLALVILVVAGWLARSKKPPGTTHPHARRGNRGDAAAGTAQHAVEDIVQCAHCHTHFPASEAVAGADGTLYCSPAHQRLGHGGP
jgi:uncharacterized protein